ncbi:uncharacterized protein PHALS_03286 [Plasmopara halstedii]|uniref:Uncharacterized protein n=1 Tax=Plasmopara halstedii TaxID=4781 RepID=A0A0P1AYF3_PLAHL|nr:uncharacterized protein PHALS_03286 [Plasmopara halstedii]CEG46679.1 hypothetical protein PHALS_03286 [Plasmopara halstedii]|eukprot:XP_024583048.1 hypothetical protein PHALS_03286 [Plasmopara halstedii]
MKKSKHQALPLVLCGLTLTSLGAMPLLELGYALDVSQDKMQSLRALTVFDKSALALSVLSVAIGGALLFSLWLKLSDLYALRTVKVLAIALAVIAVADAALLMSVASERGLDTPWKTSIYADHERLFEQQINDVFCHAKGLQVCELGSMAEARQIFPLQSWPVDSDRTPGRRIASSCEGFQDNVPFWDYQSKMKLCSLCANVTFEEIALQRRFGTKYNAEVLAAVAVLSFEELQWCGEYLLALTRYDHDSQ